MSSIFVLPSINIQIVLLYFLVFFFAIVALFLISFFLHFSRLINASFLTMLLISTSSHFTMPCACIWPVGVVQGSLCVPVCFKTFCKHAPLLFSFKLVVAVSKMPSQVFHCCLRCDHPKLLAFLGSRKNSMRSTTVGARPSSPLSRSLWSPPR